MDGGSINGGTGPAAKNLHLETFSDKSDSGSRTVTSPSLFGGNLAPPPPPHL